MNYGLTKSTVVDETFLKYNYVLFGSCFFIIKCIYRKINDKNSYIELLTNIEEKTRSINIMIETVSIHEIYHMFLYNLLPI